MKKKTLGFVSIFLFLFILTAFSKSRERFDIWENCDSFRQKKIRVFSDVYRPDADKSNRSAVIVCPGGSYFFPALKRESEDVATLLTQRGFTVFVLKYRTALGGYHHPAMLQDLQRSIQLVRENSDAYGIDSEKVGVMGFSAGGHLAGAGAILYQENFLESLGIHPKVSLKPYFAVMVYPVVTMRPPYCHKKSCYSLLGKKPSEEMLQRMSLEENTHSGVPPLLILQARDDKTVDYRNSLLLAQALSEKNIPHRTILYGTGGHGFGGKPNPKVQMANWFEDFMTWYKTNKF